MYQSILVVIDADTVEQKALTRALELARLHQAKLTLFFSIYDFAYEMTTLLSGEEREQMRHSLIADREEWLGDVLADYDLNEIQYDVEIVWHHRPFESIISHAIDAQHDLIIKGTHKHKILQSVIFTPTDWSLLRKAPCPVLLVKDHAWQPNGKILTAVNAASDSETHRLLNRKLISHGAYLSKKLNAELHLINCYPGAPSAIAVEIPEFNSLQYQQSVETFHKEAMSKLG